MPPPRSLTWEAVVTRRLTRHHLRRPAPSAQAVEVVRAVAGLQAQVLSAAGSTTVNRGARFKPITRRQMWRYIAP